METIYNEAVEAIKSGNDNVESYCQQLFNLYTDDAGLFGRDEYVYKYLLSHSLGEVALKCHNFHVVKFLIDTSEYSRTNDLWNVLLLESLEVQDDEASHFLVEYMNKKEEVLDIETEHLKEILKLKDVKALQFVLDNNIQIRIDEYEEGEECEELIKELINLALEVPEGKSVFLALMESYGDEFYGMICAQLQENV